MTMYDNGGCWLALLAPLHPSQHIINANMANHHEEACLPADFPVHAALRHPVHLDPGWMRGWGLMSSLGRHCGSQPMAWILLPGPCPLPWAC